MMNIEIANKQLSIEGLKAFNVIIITLSSITGILFYCSQYYIGGIFLTIVLTLIFLQSYIYYNFQMSMGLIKKPGKKENLENSPTYCRYFH